MQSKVITVVRIIIIVIPILVSSIKSSILITFKKKEVGNPYLRLERSAYAASAISIAVFKASSLRLAFEPNQAEVARLSALRPNS
jgi:ABC-type molybdate transport system substrate-binding protein